MLYGISNSAYALKNANITILSQREIGSALSYVFYQITTDEMCLQDGDAKGARSSLMAMALLGITLHIQNTN
jgi:hypothetical protein